MRQSINDFFTYNQYYLVDYPIFYTQYSSQIKLNFQHLSETEHLELLHQLLKDKDNKLNKPEHKSIKDTWIVNLKNEVKETLITAIASELLTRASNITVGTRYAFTKQMHNTQRKRDALLGPDAPQVGYGTFPELH